MREFSKWHLRQKGILPKTREYLTFFKINETKDLVKFIIIKSDDGKDYVYWKGGKYASFEERIKDGSEIHVFVREVEKDGKTYRNITPDIFHESNQDLE